MSLIVQSLNQLLDEPVTQVDQGEAEYRRGYRDGYGAVINALFELPERMEIDTSDTLSLLFAFWLHRLETWQHLPMNQQIAPPEIEWTIGSSR